MKNLLLAKSNLRKNMGLSICITLLILISSMFICVSCLLYFDYEKNAYKVANSLNTSDVTIYSYGDSITIDEEYIESIMPSTVVEYDYNENLYFQIPIEFNGGEVTPIVSFLNEDSFNREISKIEIIKEDKDIKENYIYIPYHIHTGGGINIGDVYKMKLPSKTYEFKVKGYINTIYGGSYSTNRYDMIISNDDYNKIKNENLKAIAFTLFVNYDKNVDVVKESNKLANKILVDKNVKVTTSDLNITIQSRIFISMIFFVSFLLTALIVIGIVMLMIFNNISNYIKENIKSLGVLKAMGYKSSDINKSLLLQFAILTIIGLIFGIICGYLFMPFITNMLIAQSGIPYSVKFNLLSTIITIIVIPIFILMIVLISIKKIKKVNPIVALRDGIKTHNFKKNFIPLDKSNLSLNLSLSLKNMFKNIKQNIISFITVIFLSFLMVIAVTMYQNFSRDPKLSLLTFEIVDGVLNIDNSIKDEIVNDLKNDSDIKDFKYLTMYEIEDTDYTLFEAYILEDTSKINNKDNCYKGRYPIYDNEIAISGKYALSNGYKIGDEIKFISKDKEYSYLITGFIQSTNNNGHECVLLYDGAKHIIDIDNVNSSYFFDSNISASKIIDKYNEKYGDKILSTLNFEELIKGQMDTFINVANLMVIIISIISGFIIILVLYLLMKSLIYDRRYEYGILKALGYKSKDLIIQNTLSFMPTIIIGTIFGSIISYYITNPYIGMMMRPFGIMKCTMILPIDLIILSILFIIIVSFITSIVMSLKIRKIQAVDLLKGE